MIRFITLAALVAFATPALAGGNPNATRAPAVQAERSVQEPEESSAQAKPERMDPSSNSQLIGRPTVSMGPCAFVLDSEHVAARRIPETSEAMRSLGVDCLDAGTRQLDGQTRLYDAGTRRDVSLAGIDAKVATFADGDLIATGNAAPFAAISSGNNSMFMPGMMMPGLGQMGTLAFQSAAMGPITPPPAAPAPSTTTSSATDARVRELESEVVSLRAANDALAE